MDLAFRALDAYSRFSAIEAVRVGGDAEASESDAVSGVCAVAAGGGGEGEEHGGVFVGAGGGVFVHSGEDGGGFGGGGGDGVVECLEAPGQGVDADYEGSCQRIVQREESFGGR